MKWITRERVKVNRVACPWLIRKFIDPQAEFLFVAPDRVMATAAAEGATPYNVPGVELGHHGGQCSFDAFIEKYHLTGPALAKMRLIVRGADTSARDLAPEAAGLYAIAAGFAASGLDDAELLKLEVPRLRRAVPLLRLTASSLDWRQFTHRSHISSALSPLPFPAREGAGG